LKARKGTTELHAFEERAVRGELEGEESVGGVEVEAALFADFDPVREREQQVHGDHAVEAELAVFFVDGRIREGLVVTGAGVIEARGISGERHGSPFCTEAEEFELARVEVPAEAEGRGQANAAFELEGVRARGGIGSASAGFSFLHADDGESAEEADVRIGGEGAEEGQFAAERNDVELRGSDELNLAELIIDEAAGGAVDAGSSQVDGGEFAGRDIVGSWRGASSSVDGFALKFVGERRCGGDAVGTPNAEAEPVGWMPTDAKSGQDCTLVFVEQGEGRAQRDFNAAFAVQAQLAHGGSTSERPSELNFLCLCARRCYECRAPSKNCEHPAAQLRKARRAKVIDESTHHACPRTWLNRPLSSSTPR